MVQNHVFRIYDLVFRLPPHAQSVNFELRRDNHIEYLTKSLKQLGPSFTVLDANRPWLCYWIIHSIALLGDCLDDKLEYGIVDFLQRCQDPNGGYGGGPGQMPHLATTYAAVNALITVGGQRSLSSIDRKKLYAFLLRMKDASGGFRMHDGGEVDVRACYTAISVASVLNILDDRLIQSVGDYILSCQTHEGGIAGEPGSEAHGGYTFCGLAAMVLINEVNRLDLPGLININYYDSIILGGRLDWHYVRSRKQIWRYCISFKLYSVGAASPNYRLALGCELAIFYVIELGGIQARVECGFQGRTNKLVDGCYSFWQGGVAAIIQRLHLLVNEQLGLPNTFKYDCGTESDNDSSDSGGEPYSDGEASPENDIRQPMQEGKSNASAAIGVNDDGYKFIKGPIGMTPLFNSMALQQYILLCSQGLSKGKSNLLWSSDY
ncbi:protein farnesyltransferase subunit beta [Sesamum angolense]|uniref:Protein farnesyltransferase subunit beta n=1 Tax=Sesamum angolense TaxID=2727404 RepID=A0AAE1WGT1_9LAMI|nr:protein farnesyltransferase subunit beta [Sesamum angolense]